MVSGQGPGMANWTAKDVAFRTAVNRSVTIAGLLATLGVLLASWHLSTRLVRPLKVMTRAASAFGEGRLSERPWRFFRGRWRPYKTA